MAYIDLNEHISVDLGDGQFVERTDILTEYSDKLKIYQSTSHENNGQNFAWIKLTPQCSYDLYIIANSEINKDYICVFNGYLETWNHDTYGWMAKHTGVKENYTDLYHWKKVRIFNDTNEVKYYTIVWSKNAGSNKYEDIGLFAINITTEPILLSNVLFQDNARLIYLGNEIIRTIKYNDVNVYDGICGLFKQIFDNGQWITQIGWSGTSSPLAEQYNDVIPVWFRSNTFSDSTSLSVSLNILYRYGNVNYRPNASRQVNIMLYVYDADGNRISKQEKPIACSNEIGITAAENTIGLSKTNSVGLYAPYSLSETKKAFTSFPDLYKLTFDDVTIPSGGMYEIFFTSLNNPKNSTIAFDRNIQENIL